MFRFLFVLCAALVFAAPSFAQCHDCSASIVRSRIVVASAPVIQFQVAEVQPVYVPVVQFQAVHGAAAAVVVQRNVVQRNVIVQRNVNVVQRNVVVRQPVVQQRTVVRSRTVIR